jgi:tRNA A-37 threonylcarbamoyl transferase component Bud32
MSATPTDRQRQVDQLCDRFEAAWKAARASGSPPRLEDCLAPAPPDLQDAVLRELILLDLYYQTQAGSRPTPQEYRHRFPVLDPAWLADAVAQASPPAAADTRPKLAIPVDDITSAAALVAVLRRHDLLPPCQLDQLPPIVVGPTTEPKKLAGELVRRGWLTPYQANQVLQGRGQELVLGGYVLLERLGAGGMGQVFKARHQKLGRVVALKLIRKERLHSAAVARRFLREIRAAAQLEHPHIVRAFDAEEVNGTTFLVLEYVAGIDLGRLVARDGPLPAAQACDFVRQAALGLQHAYERGLVHRDVKPSNLLLCLPGGVVKVLDLGLARLAPTAEGVSSTTLTDEGTVMGTPDYMAPEQAEESHTVDIRADIYSLGCTLYFLLAGRAPFAGGTLAQKIRRHLLDEPQPLEQLRNDLLPGLPAVLRKMLAKRPEDRYQAPAEAADALAALAREATLPATAPTATGGDGTATVEKAAPAGHDLAGLGWTEEPAPAPGRPEEERRQWRLIGVSGIVLVGLLALLVVLLVRSQPPPEKKAEAPPAPLPREPLLNKPFDPLPQRWLDKVAALPPEKQAQEVGEVLRIRNPGFDGKVHPQIGGNSVWFLNVDVSKVTDLTPVRALPGLNHLDCVSVAPGAPLADLRPLQGLSLTLLTLSNTSVTDLAPLHGMPLQTLYSHGTPLRDLGPLADMPLTTLQLDGSRVEDLGPLKKTPLVSLSLRDCPVEHLDPLAGLPLQTLGLYNTKVEDLTPLRGMKTLALLSLSYTPVKDLGPLRGLKLTSLDLAATPVVDLRPLEGMPLELLWLTEAKDVTGFSVLRTLPLRQLSVATCPHFSDLKVLGDQPQLELLWIHGTAVTDLTPLRTLAKLKTLYLDDKLARQHADLLRSLKLETINNEQAAQFWKRLDSPPPKP